MVLSAVYRAAVYLNLLVGNAKATYIYNTKWRTDYIMKCPKDETLSIRTSARGKLMNKLALS